MASSASPTLVMIRTRHSETPERFEMAAAEDRTTTVSVLMTTLRVWNLFPQSSMTLSGPMNPAHADEDDRPMARMAGQSRRKKKFMTPPLVRAGSASGREHDPGARAGPGPLAKFPW